MTANNDAQVRIFDAENFANVGCFKYDWSVNVSAIIHCLDEIGEYSNIEVCH